MQRKLFSWILEFAQQAEQFQKYCHSVLKRLINIIKVSCERGLAFRGEDRQYIGSVENGNYFGTLELLAQYDDFLNQHTQKLGSHPYKLCVLNNSVGC